MYIPKRLIVFLILAAVLAFGVLFSIQNTAEVPLDILILRLPEQSLALWVLLAFALGGIIGMLISGWAILRLKSETMLVRRKLARREQELKKLRTSDLRVPDLRTDAPAEAKKASLAKR